MTERERRIARVTRLLAVVTVLLPALAQAGDRVDRERRQIREGTVLDARDGRFEMAGEQISFVPTNAMTSIRCLENLALERIAEQLPGIGQARTWVVTGTVTEFQGRNYLLVTRAVLKTRATP